MQIPLIYVAAAVAFILVGLFVVALAKQEGYRQDVRRKIKVVIKRETGFPLTKIVEPMQDGWVRVDKGDYKLPDEDKQKQIYEGLTVQERLLLRRGISVKTYNKLTREEQHFILKDLQIVPPAMEWDFYPSNPFLGLKQLRVPIRKQEFYENDPRPITWLRDREPGVTAVEAQGHTRQMDALTAGIRAKELESKSRQMMEAFGRIANKTFVYAMLAAILVVSIIILVQNGGLPIPGG